jgi:glutamate 5-kinase
MLGQIAALNDGEFIIVSSGAILLHKTIVKVESKGKGNHRSNKLASIGQPI